MDLDRPSGAEGLAARRIAEMRRALAGCSFAITALAADPMSTGRMIQSEASGEPTRSGRGGESARFRRPGPPPPVTEQPWGVSGYEQADDVVTSVRISYPGAGPDGPRIVVETSCWTGTRVSSAPLRTALQDNMRGHGDRFSAVEWTDGPVTILLDGRPVAGLRVSAGDRWWAVRCTRGDVEITVVARDWHPAQVGLETVAEPVPLLHRSGSRRTQLTGPPASVPPPSRLSSEPHRALVDAALRSAREQAEWHADGGPVPQLPQHWGSLWEAAVVRQMTLADQSRTVAEWSVRSVVSQLCALQEDATWFHSDDVLRKRAIAETLLYGTGLDQNVSSRGAQLAWHSRYGQPRPTDYPDVEEAAALDGRWIDHWAAWAVDHAGH